jgi:hypothetical protein
LYPSEQNRVSGPELKIAEVKFNRKTVEHGHANRVAPRSSPGLAKALGESTSNSLSVIAAQFTWPMICKYRQVFPRR